MKIVVTGSLGHVSQPLTKALLQNGHAVTVISSKAGKKDEIATLGAIAAIGSLDDESFLTNTFTGADAVYCMLPPGGFFDADFDLMAYSTRVAGNYVEAIKKSGVKRVVYLSSIGAHTDKGNGILAFHYNAENILRTLPSGVAISFLRPVGFYYNLMAFIPGIKQQGVMASNYGADDYVPWVSPIDIAEAAVRELTTSFSGHKILYIASEEITCNNIASQLGASIGKPDLKWIIIPDQLLLDGMVAIGMNKKIAAGLVEMNGAIHDGSLFEDYYRNRPKLGNVKIKDFAPGFAAIYKQAHQ